MLDSEELEIVKHKIIKDVKERKKDEIKIEELTKEINEVLNL